MAPHRSVVLSLFAPIAVIASAASATDRMDSKAPDAPAGARYCLKVEAPTGTRLEKVLCLTREEWAKLEVDVDHEWAKEGVRVDA